MALSVLQIYNQALSLVGTRASVSSLTERTRECELCNEHYEVVRDQVLRAAPWACARKAARLGLLAEREDGDWTAAQPIPPWLFAYALPSDYLHPRMLTAYARFEIATHAGANALLTNTEDAVLIYTAKETDTSLWDIMLTSAVFLGLAAVIAKPLTGSTRKRQALVEEANMRIMLAREADANLSHDPVEWLPDWLKARGVSGPGNPNRFIYPVGPLLMGDTVG